MNKETKERLDEFIRLGKEKRLPDNGYDEDLHERYALYDFILKLQERGVKLTDFSEPWRSGTKIAFRYKGKHISLQIKSRKGWYVIWLTDVNSILADPTYALSNYMHKEFLHSTGVCLTCDYDEFFQEEMTDEEMEVSRNKNVFAPFVTRFLEDDAWVHYLYTLLDNPLVAYEVDFTKKTFTKSSVLRDTILFESTVPSDAKDMDERMKEADTIPEGRWGHIFLTLTDKFALETALRSYREDNQIAVIARFLSIQSSEDDSFEKKFPEMYFIYQGFVEKDEPCPATLKSLWDCTNLKKMMRYINMHNVTFTNHSFEDDLRCTVAYTKKEIYPIPSGLDTPNFYKE